MRIVLTLIFIFQIGILSAQKTQSELIIGKWRFEMECDFRTEEEKYIEPKINYFETENGTHYPDIIFKLKNEVEFYYTKTNSVFGIYKLNKNKLIIERRLEKEQAEQNPKAIEWSLERNLIKKKKDGHYYFKPQELTIKTITENQIEFGTEKHYTIWKRIK